MSFRQKLVNLPDLEVLFTGSKIISLILDIKTAGQHQKKKPFAPPFTQLSEPILLSDLTSTSITQAPVGTVGDVETVGGCDIIDTLTKVYKEGGEQCAQSFKKTSRPITVPRT